MIQATVNLRNIVYSSITDSNVAYNTDTAIYKNTRSTSSEVKCSLPSSLVNFKSVAMLSLSSITGLSSYSTEVYLNINTDFTVPGSFLPKHNTKTVHLEGKGSFTLSGNAIVEYDLLSPSIPNNNKIEAIIPPSSCFNLTLMESITTVTIPFAAQGSLRSIDSGNVIQDITLTGTIMANVLSTDYSEASPCNNKKMVRALILLN